MNKEELKQQLANADAKCDWEGGLAEMILGYGGSGFFPEELQPVIARFVGAYERLERELIKLSEKVGYDERMCW